MFETAGMILGQLRSGTASFLGGPMIGLYAIIFPYIQKILLHLFDFKVTDFIANFFQHDTFLGSLFQSGSVLGAGVGMMSIGGAVRILQQLWVRIHDIYCRHFTISLTIPSCGETYEDYEDVRDWVQERTRDPKIVELMISGLKTNHVRLKKERVQSATGTWSWNQVLAAADEKKIKVPTSFEFRGKNFDYFLKESQDLKMGKRTSSCDTDVFLELLADVKKSKRRQTTDKMTIFTGSDGFWRRSTHPRRKRPLASVILDQGISEIILSDVKDFLDSAQWYADFGIPHRRGYLLHGPPGTGKTSLIGALAGHFDLNICILNLSDKNLTDDSLNRMLLRTPEHSIILLEDVDAAFVNRAAENGTGENDMEKGSSVAAYSGRNSLTFGGLLNALDGLASAEGQLVFMTTNHIEKLDAALIRPGRVDVQKYIGYATEYQLDRMFRRFHRSANEEEVTQFVRAVLDQPEPPRISMARMQDLFLRFKRNPSQAVTGVAVLAGKQSPTPNPAA